MVTVKQKFIYLPDGTLDVSSWLNKICHQHPHTKPELIQKAALLAMTRSTGLTTFYGQPCIEQGLEMAEILLDMHLDQHAISAAILLSSAQHTSLSIDDITEQMGEAVAKLVQGSLQMNSLSALQSGLQAKSRDQIQIDRLRKVFLSMVSDIRVVLIKLAERTCIMRGIKNINPTERKRIAQETMDIYAPLANRLGIGQLKWELEDIAFHYTNTDAYKSIANFLAERRSDREQHIHDTIQLLKEHLALVHIDAKISGRAKHIYSIYLKMMRKDLDLKHIYDYSAVRLLVPKIQDCYTALSIVHSLFEHIPEEFDDYISHPKPNGYRSIHTAVIDRSGKNLEIQIRTEDMHTEAEHGVAAHWIYKESKTPQSGYEEKITFLRQLLAWHKDVAQHDKTPEKNIEQILEDRVYVFTPNGEVIDLSIGATPLDFAYHIHSELGHRCRGAKIKGHIVPLSYHLRTGDQVEIITTPHGTPSRDWLNKESGYLNTARARAKVAHWFKQQDVNKYVELGKQHLEKELARTGKQISFEKIAAQLNFKTVDALFAAIGHGNVRITQALHQLHADVPARETKTPLIAPKQSAPLPKGFEVAGINDLLTRLARCCKPIPGDDVVGYITQGRGVTIHRHDCNNIQPYLSRHDDRLIIVAWDSKNSGSYYVDLQIRGNGQHELLKEITALLANAKIDLIALNSTISKKNNMIYIVMTIQIHDITQLKAISAQISQLPKVIDVRRVSE